MNKSRIAGLPNATLLLVAAAAMVGTLPGRTQGLGLITEPLLADLGIDRVSYAEVNFCATIAGSVFALGVGRLVDRMGARRILTAVALALGVVVLGMSRAAGLRTLALYVMLTRGLGQSALSVVSLTMMGQWFAGEIERAMAIYSVVMSVGFMVAFPAVGALVQAGGWRTAWLSIGVALVAGLAPAGWLLVPSAVGRGRDGHRDRAVLAGYPLTAALATPAFWVFAVGTALYGLVASGIGLFNESILHERGFSAAVYYQTLAVTAMTALAGNFAGGWLAERVPLGRLMAASLVILSAGLAGLPYVRSLTGVIVWASAMGIGGGLVMVLFFSVWSRVFGRRALGRIQGAAQALTVLASATGPILLAWCVESTGSYARMFQILAVVIGVVAVTSLVVPLPPARE